MASPRVDNGAPIYDSTIWREVPAITLMPQWSHIHEVPIYGEVQYDATGQAVLGWAIHGPQEPLEIGIEGTAVPLPDKGVNPVTGNPRMQFDACRSVPYVHAMVLEWWDRKRNTVFHWEGGVRQHTVTHRRVWYPKSSYDDGTHTGSPNIDQEFAVSSDKIIFMQRMILDAAGQPAVAASCTNWAKVGQPIQVAGGPSRFKLSHRGTKLYPKFVRPNGTETDTLTVQVNEAKFNPMRLTLARPFINRQGLVVDTAGFHDMMHSLTLDMLSKPGILAPDWDTWQMGDELPYADTPATIQH